MLIQSFTPNFRDALRFWMKLGWINFGGPTGQIAILHHELVTRKKWIEENHFLHALNFCMILPGPEAHQLAIYLGWLLHGTRGALAAGIFFVLPSLIILWLLSYFYVLYGQMLWVSSIFEGLRAAILAIIVGAVIRLGKKTIQNKILVLIAWFAFLGLTLFKISFPWIILSAAATGIIFKKELSLLPTTPLTGPAALVLEERFNWNQFFKTLTLGLLIWWGPILLAGILAGWQSVFFQQGLFFSKAALVTFGGAYAVLPYVAQHAVDQFGWLTHAQMMDGLALAETTPGPLVIVLQFVGFLGGWHKAGSLPPLLTATFCSGITAWATFVPSFLWIFLGASYTEKLQQKKNFVAALAAIAAAVLGVLASLTFWFAQAAFLKEGKINFFVLLTAGACFWLLKRLEYRVVPIILFGALAGAAKFYFLS
ncbi:MAG: chromate efflux transporter [Verrucomicrobiae bacterium]|nr:chromate efflux transporter [Verrucomicrobiae bacterium]